MNIRVPNTLEEAAQMVEALPEFQEFLGDYGRLFEVDRELALKAWTTLAAQVNGPVLRAKPAPKGLVAFLTERYGQITVTIETAQRDFSSDVLMVTLRRAHWLWTIYVPENLFGEPRFVEVVVRLGTGTDFDDGPIERGQSAA